METYLESIYDKGKYLNLLLIDTVDIQGGREITVHRQIRYHNFI